MQRLGPTLTFHKGVDNFTGYRSRQMLVLPLAVEQTVLGVLQLINFKGTGPFPAMVVEGARELAQTLAVAMLRRRQGAALQQGAAPWALRPASLLRPRQPAPHLAAMPPPGAGAA